jgi:hypothetical protein
MIEVWRELPPEFRFPDPEAPTTVWRGDKLGRLATGMSCRLADTDADPVQTVLDIARQGGDALNDLIDRHTSAYHDSPLVSVAGDIRLAQLFAGFRDRDETIYEINVPAHRLLRNPENIGTRRWPKDSELFMIGAIKPSDIVGYKQNNTDRGASELLIWEVDGCYIANALTDFREIPTPERPNPRGKWVDLGKSVVEFA